MEAISGEFLGVWATVPINTEKRVKKQCFHAYYPTHIIGIT